jgi:transposase
MSVTAVVVGIDVAKAHLDAAVLGAKLEAARFANQAEGHTALSAALRPLGVALVVMEPTGGYEAALACAHDCGNWRPARRSARGMLQCIGR